MHNTPEQNADFRAAWDATNARWKAAQKAHEAEQAAKTNQPTQPEPTP